MFPKDTIGRFVKLKTYNGFFESSNISNTTFHWYKENSIFLVREMKNVTFESTKYSVFEMITTDSNIVYLRYAHAVVGVSRRKFFSDRFEIID